MMSKSGFGRGARFVLVCIILPSSPPPPSLPLLLSPAAFALSLVRSSTSSCSCSLPCSSSSAVRCELASGCSSVRVGSEVVVSGAAGGCESGQLPIASVDVDIGSVGRATSQQLQARMVMGKRKHEQHALNQPHAGPRLAGGDRTRRPRKHRAEGCAGDRSLASLFKLRSLEMSTGKSLFYNIA